MSKCKRFLGAERPCRLMVTSKFRVIWADLVLWRNSARLLEGYRQPLAQSLKAASCPISVFCFSTPGRWQQVVQWHCHPWCLSYLSSVETPSGSRKDQQCDDCRWHHQEMPRGPHSPGTPWWPQVGQSHQCWVCLVQTPVPKKNPREIKLSETKTNKICASSLSRSHG